MPFLFIVHSSPPSATRIQAQSNSRPTLGRIYAISGVLLFLSPAGSMRSQFSSYPALGEIDTIWASFVAPICLGHYSPVDLLPHPMCGGWQLRFHLQPIFPRTRFPYGATPAHSQSNSHLTLGKTDALPGTVTTHSWQIRCSLSCSHVPHVARSMPSRAQALPPSV